MASDRCACGAYPLDQTPDYRHGLSCSPGQGDEHVRACQTDWCCLSEGHGGLHRARPTVAVLRARLAEAERLLRKIDNTAWHELAFCLICNSTLTEHAPGCALARWLEGGASK